jgi:single-strand DNA-binding protein
LDRIHSRHHRRHQKPPAPHLTYPLSATMNSVNLIGRAVAKPTIKYVGQSNRPLAEFTLAVDDTFAKPDPDTGRRPAFFFWIMVWGQKADVAAAHIDKGRRIGITGRLTQDTFTPAGSDKPITKTRIVAETFDLLDKPALKPSDSSDWSDASDHTPF